MKNMFSPYQQRKANIIPVIYNKVDLIMIKNKITKLTKIVNNKDENLTRIKTAKNLLIINQNNFEFIARQLNQQNIEGV